VRFEFRDSAGKYGFTRIDAMTAIAYFERYAPNFDVSRQDGVTAVSAWVGPAVGGRSIEVFGYMPAAGVIVVFHAMDVRPRTLARIDEIERRRS
jgi:hypothetical protein